MIYAVLLLGGGNTTKVPLLSKEDEKSFLEEITEN